MALIRGRARAPSRSRLRDGNLTHDLIRPIRFIDYGKGLAFLFTRCRDPY
jgi:hypothetical protein